MINSTEKESNMKISYRDTDGRVWRQVSPGVWETIVQPAGEHPGMPITSSWHNLVREFGPLKPTGFDD